MKDLSNVINYILEYNKIENILNYNNISQCPCYCIFDRINVALVNIRDFFKKKKKKKKILQILNSWTGSWTEKSNFPWYNMSIYYKNRTQNFLVSSKTAFIENKLKNDSFRNVSDYGDYVSDHSATKTCPFLNYIIFM